MIPNDLAFSMSTYWYEQWYYNDVSPNLSRQQKMNLVKKISDLSLREPIFHGGLYYPKEDFPELAPYVSRGATMQEHPVTKKKGQLTGVQLYAVLMAAAQELGIPTTRASTVYGKPIIPDLPRTTKRFIKKKELIKDSFKIKKKHKKIKEELEPGIIGTDLVPSIENREGCDKFNGKWLNDYGICLFFDGRKHGYTAPIKGAYFFWSRDPTWELESAGGCHVYGDDHYPRGIGTCRSKIQIKYPKGLRDPRRAVLKIASDVMKGKGRAHGLVYTSPNGRIVGSNARNAVAGNNPNQIRMFYDRLKMEEIEPFKLR